MTFGQCGLYCVPFLPGSRSSQWALPTQRAAPESREDGLGMASRGSNIMSGAKCDDYCTRLEGRQYEHSMGTVWAQYGHSMGMVKHGIFAFLHV